MSWGSWKTEKYVRAPRKTTDWWLDQEEEEDRSWFYYIDHQYDWECDPTLKDIATGRLLTTLLKLDIYCAKKALEQVYW